MEILTTMFATFVGFVTGVLFITEMVNKMIKVENTNVRMVVSWAMPSNPYGKSHIVKQHVNKDTYESMSEEQRRNMPIVGGIKPMVKNEQ